MPTFAPFASPARASTQFYDCAALTASGYTIADQFGTASRKTQVATFSGRPCLQMTGLDSTLQLNITKDAALDFQRDAEGIYILLAASDPSLLEAGTATRVYCYPETSIGSNTPDTSNFTLGGIWATQEIGDHWVLCYVPFSLMTVTGTGSVTDHQNKKISRIGIRVTVASGTKPDVYVGGIWIGGASRAKCVLSYDGSFISQLNLAKPAHDLYGFPGTLYVAKHRVDTDANYLTSANLDTFYAAGWSISGHSFASAEGLDSKPSSQAMVDEIGNFRAWALGRGYVRGDGHWAYGYTVPTTNASESVRAMVYAALKSSGLKTARVGGAGSGLSHLRSNALALGISGASDPQTIYSPQITSSLTIAQARAFVEAGIRHRMAAHIYIHEIAANQGATVSGSATNYVTPTNYDQTTTPGATQSLMPWLATQRRAGLVDVVSIDDWYRGLTQPTLVA
jgi:hypothetical protein